MDFRYPRKLLPESILSDFCNPICNITAYCEPTCLTYCPTDCSCRNKCLTDLFRYIPAPSPPLYQQDIQKSTTTPKLLITSLVSLSAVFLIVCFWAVYYRFHRRRTVHQQSSQPRDEFLDQGPILDHPIWYIRTTGLQQSIISSIAVLRYKKGEGVVDGSDCSVCLSEFQDDDPLRLLPKCSHAFHVSCIDTWLRSHTNCPLCRAPIVISSTRFQTSVVISGSLEEERQVGFPDSSSSSTESDESQSHNREIDNGGSELNAAEEVEVEGEGAMQGVHPRRSVSLDSVTAAKINVDLCNVHVLEAGDEDLMGVGDVNEERSSGSSDDFVVGNARLKSSSSVRTSSNSCVPMKRSISWSGISLPSRHSRNQ